MEDWRGRRLLHVCHRRADLRLVATPVNFGGVGRGESGPDASLRRLLKVASTGEWAARIELADTEDLPPEVYRALLEDEAREVIALLAGNRSTPRDVLETLAQRDHALTERVDLNPNASPTRKERVPIWKHTQVSLERYFDELDLAPAVRARILNEWMVHAPDSLGEVRARNAD